MAEEKESTICEAVYEKKGADAFNACMSAKKSCGNDLKCLADWEKYQKALGDDYDKSFQAFRADLESKRKSTFKWVAVGAGALAVITIIYFISKRK